MVFFLEGLGVLKVFVRETEISFDALRGVAHSLQYLELEGLLVSHMGHLIAILALKKAWGKNNKESEKSQLD